jgi:hypothetical protein
MDGLHGLCDFDKRTILVNEDSTPEEKAVTLFHETLHMTFAISGMAYTLEDKQEEAIVRCIENGLWPLLKDMWTNSTNIEKDNK